jgi:hypothetical protein
LSSNQLRSRIFLALKRVDADWREYRRDGSVGIDFEMPLRLPTAPGLPLAGNGDFGTSAFFGPLSDKPLLACIRGCGGSTVKHNGW